MNGYKIWDIFHMISAYNIVEGIPSLDLVEGDAGKK